MPRQRARTRPVCDVRSAGEAPPGRQGIGAGFVPKNCDLSVVDEIIKVSLPPSLPLSLSPSLSPSRFGRFAGARAGGDGGAARADARPIARDDDDDEEAHALRVVPEKQARLYFFF